MLTPTVTQFLTEISNILSSRDASKLCSYLVIEPPYAPIYETLRSEVRSSFNSQDGTSAQRLESTCLDKLNSVLTDPEGYAPTWTAFNKFMAQYFIFLRDVDVSNLLTTYELLSELLQYLPLPTAPQSHLLTFVPEKPTRPSRTRPRASSSSPPSSPTPACSPASPSASTSNHT